MLFWPCIKCSLLVVDVSESRLEVAANNSRLSRHNVNYTSADLAQNVNSQPCHWVISTRCRHTRSDFSKIPSRSALNTKELPQPTDFWKIPCAWGSMVAYSSSVFGDATRKYRLWSSVKWSRFGLAHQLMLAGNKKCTAVRSKNHRMVAL